MGTGKTTVGRLLAERFGLCFVDMDEEVERRADCTISQLFASAGEALFRSLERDLLRELATGEDCIIATGGGSLLSEESRDLLPPDDRVICLTCNPKELGERLADGSDRPLLSSGGQQKITELLDLRALAYACFEQLDTTERTPEEVAGEIGRRLGLSQAAELDFTSHRRSRILVERGAAQLASSLFAEANLHGDVVLVTDEIVAALGLADQLRSELVAADWTVHLAQLPPGENHKNLDTLNQLYSVGLEHHLDRRAVVVGLGGGVIGDIAGMFAATYVRGLHLVLMPTTLLAQIDASIGGKVGVDFHTVKNMVGAFYPADLVIIDPDVLRTLPRAGIVDGLAEMVKIAVVRSPGLLAALEALVDAADVIDQSAVIRKAALEKVHVVEKDPRDQGERELLNFGHSIGHAVEAASDYRLSHGQAIAIGMVAETWLADASGWCSSGVLERLDRLLRRFELPTTMAGLDAETVFSYLSQDKKRKGSQIRFAVPTRIGGWGVFVVDDAQARAAVNRALRGDP